MTIGMMMIMMMIMMIREGLFCANKLKELARNLSLSRNSPAWADETRKRQFVWFLNLHRLKS
jgi:hypothetical protein